MKVLWQRQSQESKNPPLLRYKNIFGTFYRIVYNKLLRAYQERSSCNLSFRLDSRIRQQER